jgi:hypothetical protein
VCGAHSKKSVLISSGALVDTVRGGTRLVLVMAKPRKVQEPAGTYAAKPVAAKVDSAGTHASTEKKSASTAARQADETTFRKAAEKVFKTHDELFRKLAQ